MKLLTFIKYSIIFACMYISRPIYSQQLSHDPLYKMVFFDEFDSIGLNHNKWNTTYHYAFNLLNENMGTSCGSPDSLHTVFDYQFNYPGENNRAYDTTDSGFIRLIHKKENFTAPLVSTYSPCISCDTIMPCSGNACWNDSLVPFKYSGSLLRSHYYFKYPDTYSLKYHIYY